MAIVSKSSSIQLKKFVKRSSFLDRCVLPFNVEQECFTGSLDQPLHVLHVEVEDDPAVDPAD